MKALTVLQPWATLIAIQAKSLETRSWYTPRRGLLAIHAGKSFPRDHRALCRQSPFAEALYASGYHGPAALPLGVVVAICRLDNCYQVHLGADGTTGIPAAELPLGFFALGRFVWKLTHVARLHEPVPAKGSQGLWDWEPGRYLKGWLAEHGYE